MEKEFVKVNGMEFTKAGKEILFRGMGIGSWLNMEHFMLGIPTPDNQIRKTVKEVFGKETADRFFDRFIRSFISDSDFAFLKKCGVNSLLIIASSSMIRTLRNTKKRGFAISII